MFDNPGDRTTFVCSPTLKKAALVSVITDQVQLHRANSTRYTTPARHTRRIRQNPNALGRPGTVVMRPKTDAKQTLPNNRIQIQPTHRQCPRADWRDHETDGPRDNQPTTDQHPFDVYAGPASKTRRPTQPKAKHVVQTSETVRLAASDRRAA